ncbi:MAG: hypothetical protein PHE18_01435 [Candidatus Omnitrophica bacterium]|nr:hypothetical protein [Candidatus Omnitrophota bacterium]MDD5552518.1 hypothetical protein [Candidatus Omnitrophota bacterium]
MKLFRVPLAAVLALAILSGCSSYQLSSKNKSVIVDKISPNTFAVNFCGNAYMSQQEVEKYAMQRASEVTLSEGFAYFEVLNKRDDSEMCALAYKKMPSASTPGETQMEASPTYETPQFMRPNVTLTIRCYSAFEQLPGKAVNAQDYLRENFPGMEKQS